MRKDRNEIKKHIMVAVLLAATIAMTACACSAQNKATDNGELSSSGISSSSSLSSSSSSSSSEESSSADESSDSSSEQESSSEAETSSSKAEESKSESTSSQTSSSKPSTSATSSKPTNTNTSSSKPSSNSSASSSKPQQKPVEPQITVSVLNDYAASIGLKVQSDTTYITDDEYYEFSGKSLSEIKSMLSEVKANGAQAVCIHSASNSYFSMTVGTYNPGYTQAEINSIVSNAIAYGKQLGMTYESRFTTENCSWGQPIVTNRIFDKNIDKIQTWTYEGVKYDFDSGANYFNVVAVSIGGGHWEIYTLYA